MISTTEWRPVAVLPNVFAEFAFDAGPMALVGVHDSRLHQIVLSSPAFGEFLSRFTNDHGDKVLPSTIIQSDQLPLGASSDMVSSFRDIVVASYVLKSRQTTIRWKRVVGTFYSRAFDIYPWILGNDGYHLFAQTPAISAMHVLDGFRAHAYSDVPISHLAERDIEKDLFNRLSTVWRRRFVEGIADRQDISLLRSLNMANAAMKPAGGTDSVLYDFGRIIANWVAAFEILVNNRAKNEKSSDLVCKLLDSAPWQSKAMLKKDYAVRSGKGQLESVTLPRYAYRHLNKARNDFLHGNPVEISDLTMPGGGRLLDIAAPLYRIALGAFLGRPPLVEIPVDATDQQRIETDLDNYDALEFQRQCEASLIKCFEPLIS